jgi:hypothetical protein
MRNELRTFEFLHALVDIFACGAGNGFVIQRAFKGGFSCGFIAFGLICDAQAIVHHDAAAALERRYFLQVRNRIVVLLQFKLRAG